MRLVGLLLLVTSLTTAGCASNVGVTSDATERQESKSASIDAPAPAERGEHDPANVPLSQDTAALKTVTQTASAGCDCPRPPPQPWLSRGGSDPAPASPETPPAPSPAGAEHPSATEPSGQRP